MLLFFSRAVFFTYHIDDVQIDCIPFCFLRWCKLLLYSHLLSFCSQRAKFCRERVREMGKNIQQESEGLENPTSNCCVDRVCMVHPKKRLDADVSSNLKRRQLGFIRKRLAVVHERHSRTQPEVTSLQKPLHVAVTNIYLTRLFAE